MTDEQRKIVVGYLVFGNSLWDLIDTLTTDEQLKDILDEIPEDQHSELSIIGEEIRQSQMSVIYG